MGDPVIVPGSGRRIVVATRPVYCGKQHDGLAAAITQHQLGLDPYAPAHGSRIVLFVRAIGLPADGNLPDRTL